ncbi:MAG TPA: hypothetical protein VF677_00190 [Flavobacterium sp.]
MKKQLLICFLFPVMAFAQDKNILKVIEPVSGPGMQVRSYECHYIDNETYFINFKTLQNTKKTEIV